MKRHVACVRCGKDAAYSEEQLAWARAKAPPVEYPPIPPNVCMRCAMADPAIRAEIEAWTKRTQTQFVALLRSALARPLEAIDRFVEQMK